MSTAASPSPRLAEPSLDTGTQRRSLWPLLLLFGFLKLALQALITLRSVSVGYGHHRDEFYYLVCARRLAWGYVDNPPLVAVQAWAANAIFGFHNLVGFRFLPALGGALMVALTGLLTNALGGSRRAAVLAMLSVLTVPVYIAEQSFLSMNAWDPFLWMSAVYALVRLLRQPGTLWWVLLGSSLGLGLENKTSALFLIAALLLAMAVTRARSLFLTPGFWLAVAITTALALPHLIWQIHNNFPTWQWLRAVQHSNKDVILSPPAFLLQQVMVLSPLHLLVWLPGVAWLLFSRRAKAWQPVGVLYVFFLPLMLVLHAKDYYLAPIYPVYFAAGAVFWTGWAADSRIRSRLLLAFLTLMTAALAATLPFAVPILSPAAYVRYMRHFPFRPADSEQHPGVSFPEFFADQLDWPQLVTAVSRVYHALPPAEQSRTGILARNYGEAGALNILGRPLGLPDTISGHQNYFLWGPEGYSGNEMIVVTDQTQAELERSYQSCLLQLRQNSPYQMPWEHRGIYLCHNRFVPFSKDWDAIRFYR